MGFDTKELVKLAAEGKFWELAAMGRDAWNAWAQLEEEDGPEGRPPISLGAGGDSAWPTDWRGFVFPRDVAIASYRFDGSPAVFDDAVFLGEFTLTNSALTNHDLRFQGAEFKGTATFKGCEFKRELPIRGARFRADASFENAHFRGPLPIRFDQVDFGGAVSFRAAEFGREVYFADCQFRGGANFEYGQCSRTTYFQGDTKFWETVNFERRKFLADAVFDGTRFGAGVDLTGAEFARLASFSRCTFAEPPCLDATDFKRAPSFAYSTFLPHRGPAAHARYRELRRRAAIAHDHRSVLSLFALESRAVRSNRLSWKRPGDWAELLTSHLYELTSNFGQSIFRPFVGLALTFFVGMFGFAYVTGEGWPVFGWDQMLAVAALSSLLPFAGQSVVARKVMQEGLCPDANESAEQLGCLTKVYLVSAAEGLISVIFLFLLVLGIRNLFRIK